MSSRGTRWYRRNEAEVMEQLGFSPVPNSGAGWISKEDGENEWGLCQLKSTDKSSISVNLNDILVLEKHAAVSHKIPVFAVQYIKANKTMLMVSPEHLGLLADVLAGNGEAMKQAKALSKSELDGIITEETSGEGKVRKIKSSSKGRDSFYRQKEEERRKWKKN